jgi:hypothetical protein
VLDWSGRLAHEHHALPHVTAEDWMGSLDVPTIRASRAGALRALERRQ